MKTGMTSSKGIVCIENDLKKRVMKIENQVCTLEQAKKLKELGVEQDSISWWKCNDDQNVVICGCTKKMNEKHFSFNNWFSAFTVAELGVMLPNYEESHKATDTKGYWYCGSLEEQDNDWVVADTQAEAMAKRLIGLIEYKRVQVEEVNNRLQNK